MSAEQMPMEILVIILKKLKGKEAVACRAVCRRWRGIVDSLSDEAWERYCCLEFRDPRAANRVSTLGYRELFKSLSLWSKVDQAEVTCRQVSALFVNGFKILDSNRLAILVKDQGEDYYGEGPWRVKRTPPPTKEIQYYNIKDMELLSTEHFDFELFGYDENDRLIVYNLMDTSTRKCLWVVTKSNKKKSFRDYMYYDYDYEGMLNFKLVDTDVYYINRRGALCVAQLKVVDSEETVETVELADMSCPVLAFAYAGKNSVYILTKKWDLICYKGANLKMSKNIRADKSTVVRSLMDLGIDWTEPRLYRWLTIDTIEDEGFSALKGVRVHSHDHIVLIGTAQNVIDIFKKPYKKDGTLNLYRVKPNRSIKMDVLNRNNCVPIQLGVVEVLDGHRIIVVTGNHQLFFVDLLHKAATK